MNKSWKQWISLCFKNWFSNWFQWHLQSCFLVLVFVTFIPNCVSACFVSQTLDLLDWIHYLLFDLLSKNYKFDPQQQMALLMLWSAYQLTTHKHDDHSFLVYLFDSLSLDKKEEPLNSSIVEFLFSFLVGFLQCSSFPSMDKDAFTIVQYHQYLSLLFILQLLDHYASRQLQENVFVVCIVWLLVCSIIVCFVLLFILTTQTQYSISHSHSFLYDLLGRSGVDSWWSSSNTAPTSLSPLLGHQ